VNAGPPATALLGESDVSVAGVDAASRTMLPTDGTPVPVTRAARQRGDGAVCRPESGTLASGPAREPGSLAEIVHRVSRAGVIAGQRRQLARAPCLRSREGAHGARRVRASDHASDIVDAEDGRVIGPGQTSDLLQPSAGEDEPPAHAGHSAPHGIGRSALVRTGPDASDLASQSPTTPWSCRGVSCAGGRIFRSLGTDIPGPAVAVGATASGHRGLAACQPARRSRPDVVMPWRCGAAGGMPGMPP
jgi:hypothetical protein